MWSLTLFLDDLLINVLCCGVDAAHTTRLALERVSCLWSPEEERVLLVPLQR